MSDTRRYLIFSARKKSQHLCVVVARDERHALKVARQIFTLTQDAMAIPERQTTLAL